MKDNLIQFPSNAKQSVSKTQAPMEAPVENLDVSQSELDALRHAFDEARKQWPLEMAELPEQNRKCAHSTKR
ncbi:hypothetical protein ACFQ45_12345 [Rhodanobacter aciditrophus]|uniref:Uncharacterized protein n=1 Tax=Rhodanobacter aciditrophus TaxID=1623218 RepID=A0ABW4B465_9GAMM